MERIYNIFSKIITILNKGLKWILITLLVIMVLIVLTEICLRYIITKHSLPWSEELARYLMIWMVMLAAGLGFSYNSHIGVNFIVDKLIKTPQINKFFKLITYIIVMVFSIYLVIFGWKIAQKVSFQQSSALRISMFWAYLSLPIGGVIFLIENIKLCLDLFFKKGGGE